MKIKESLEKSPEKSYDISDIEYLRNKYLKSTVFIKKDILNDPKITQTIPIGNFYVSRFLFTNNQLVETLNILNIRNKNGGFYKIFNEFNPSIPIRFDDNLNKYIVISGFDNHPVIGVSWKRAHFIASLFSARILTEAEWVYCATNNNFNNIYPWGSEKPSMLSANYGEYYGSTTPVDKFSPNNFGIYDLAGNAEEWCSDWYFKNIPYYKNLKLASSTLNAGFTEKVVKGGAWNKEEDSMQLMSRRGKFYMIGTRSISFRLVWDKNIFIDD